MTGIVRHAPVLMTPGPVSVVDNVLQAMGAPSTFHRYETFEELFGRVTGRLRAVFRATPQHVCILFAGSGTLANEAVLSSCFGTNDKVLVASNGEFGDRLFRILSVHGVATIEFRQRDYCALDPEAVVDRAAAAGATGVAMVGMETSTGVANPVLEIGTALHSLGAQAPVLFVDAVSALGAEIIEADRAAVAYCTSVLNKGLEGPPGLSIACVDRERFRARRASVPRGVYLDISTYLAFADRQQTPWTPSIPLIRALDAALDRLDAETIDGRRSRYLRMSALLRQRLVKLGFDILAEPNALASAVTTFALPEHVDSTSLRRFLESRGYILWFPPATDGPRRMTASVMGDINEHDIDTVSRLIALFLSGVDAVADPSLQ